MRELGGTHRSCANSQFKQVPLENSRVGELGKNTHNKLSQGEKDERRASTWVNSGWGGAKVSFNKNHRSKKNTSRQGVRGRKVKEISSNQAKKRSPCRAREKERKKGTSQGLRGFGRLKGYSGLEITIPERKKTTEGMMRKDICEGGGGGGWGGDKEGRKFSKNGP